MQRIRPPARGDGELVEGCRGLAALLRRTPATARWRASTRACPPTSPACSASTSALRSRARSPRPGPIRRRRCARTRRRSGASSASPSSPGSPSARAWTGAPSAPRARRASPRPRLRKTPRRFSEHAAAFHRREVPRAGRARSGNGRRRGGIRRRGGRACAAPTPARPPAAYGGWSEGVRDRAYVAGAPIPGEVEAAARGERAETRDGHDGERGRSRGAHGDHAGRMPARAAHASPSRRASPSSATPPSTCRSSAAWLAGPAVRDREERRTGRSATRRGVAEPCGSTRTGRTSRRDGRPALSPRA